ncbi:MAG TPA: phosphatidylserine/phosphatidylglycerophosphate/cardiolipin synthase family protein [Elusimicrobiales bacterium]|nr:phosphatidylserine/phosphatidylglycerophosphate/cardiolipin synthase family protein [Elusimicrobiales bacterium]
MIKTKSVLIASLILPLISSGSFAGGDYDSRLSELQAGMERTAEALGMPVHEDWAADLSGRFDGSLSGGQAAALQLTPLRAPAARPLVPELPVIPPLPSDYPLPEPVSYTGTAVIAWHAIGAQLSDNGWIPWADGAPTFDDISKRVLDVSVSRSYPARRAGEPSLFLDGGFVAEYERAAGVSFRDGNSARYLINGPASFSVRDRLMRGAKKSLLVSSWAFYDDITGWEGAQYLILKKREGLEVKVIVDKKVAVGHGKRVLKLMEEAGIEVLRYEEKARGNDIWHVKLMIVDDEYAIVGGMNFGDVYSHKDPNNVKWRDTDVIYSGPAVAESRRLFARLWNAKVRELGLKFAPVAETASGAGEGGSARIGVVLQNPPTDSNILVSIVKAMYGATERINIENAYFVSLPVVTKAVLDAVARGVEVNIITNSKESIDPEGKTIVDAMYKCLMPLAQAGANIYLYQGDATLHSKFMTVDGVFANIGSYNLHPRGERYDTEVNVAIVDPVSTAQLDEAFANDVAMSRRVTSPDQLGEKPGWLSSFVSEYFYAQLKK